MKLAEAKPAETKPVEVKKAERPRPKRSRLPNRSEGVLPAPRRPSKVGMGRAPHGAPFCVVRL